MVKNLGEKYSPLYFLSSLGNGGMAISFFIYLMFMVPHKGTPMATFEDIFKGFINGNIFMKGIIIIALIGIIYFSIGHFKLLIWNIKEYKLFKTTEAYTKIKTTNAEVTLMALPLTFAMTINVCFVLGAVFVPGLWGVVQMLFPLAVIAFAVVGYFALKIFGEYFTRLIINGDFNFEGNNNFSPMIAIFAFSMLAVGFAASAAMSHTPFVYGVAMFVSIFFLAVTISLTFVKITLGVKSMFRNGIGVEATPSLWIMIPILTLVGITVVRLYFGTAHNFLHIKHPPFEIIFIFSSFFLALQLMFGFIGYKVMKELNYFKEYVHGEKKSPVSFALICPGVALFVFGMFFIFFGLVKTGLVDIFSPIYFILLFPLVYVQFITIKVMFKLTNKLLKA